MVFQLPPAVPAVEMVAPVFPAVVVADSDCAKGSRDCFPSDRVGLTPVPLHYRSLDLDLILADFVPRGAFPL